MADAGPYPPIGDYALLSDCRASALVSRGGSVDWCCLPRIDAGASFARLLDRRTGGFCTVEPVGEATATRRYLDGTLVLETRFSSSAGEVTVRDCLAVDPRRPGAPYGQLLRVVEGQRGVMELRMRVEARFDYGELRPWRHFHGMGVFSLIGGDDGLVVFADPALEADGAHDLEHVFSLRPGQRAHLSITFVAPHEIEGDRVAPPRPGEVDERLEQTAAWWREWSARSSFDGPDAPGVVRSAIVLKGLSNAATGAVAAAATTSLPESLAGGMNWDYRFSWIRDSAFTVRAIADLGWREEADAFRRFVQRSSAGSAEDLQIMYGVGGERRLSELELRGLEGYRGVGPVLVGNAASGQLQLDVYGELLELVWRWHERGHSPDDDFWRFVLDLVDTAAENAEKPDKGVWESRGDPEHYVVSKAMCWAALDRGIRLAEDSPRQAPLRRWRRRRDELRAAIERDGYDGRRGVFVRAYGSKQMDASLLLLPVIGFLDFDDERMIRTTDAIREELGVDGLLLRYRRDGAQEGAFLACSFWLAECLAHQGRLDEARAAFDRAAAAGNELGLFSEEYDTDGRQMLGNFPQALTHLSHITAAIALAAERGKHLEPA